ncbi:MAG TPA: SMC family ATPase [Vicinamibacteria bacterium]|nr:SMC family ATPase [Vicinamibacteria bacterium]
MRPLKLTVEGFTSFRDKLELDFSRLDLFAITGPTGAGKSSLIDAIVFALYGVVPRVGDDYKQLISHGKERLSVLLEFGVGKERYRIARTARPDRPSQQRLERITREPAEPIADRAREIRAEVDRIVGLDYDGFTRAVVLPQGQFDAFLKGEPKERRKILVALLGLGVYERMQQLAHQKGAAARTEADFLKRQLETDFADATPEALEEKKAALQAAEAGAKQAEAALASLAGAAGVAQQARSLRAERTSLDTSHAEEASRLEKARATVDGAGQAKQALDRALDELLAQKDAHGFDEARHTVLVAAKPLADQLTSLQQGVARAARATSGKRRELEEATKAVVRDEAALPGLEKAAADAQEGESAARAEKDAAHREHAATAIRRGLKPGDPCPVCAQTVKKVPEGKEPALDALDGRLEAAEALARGARERLQQARLAREKTRAKAEGLERELGQAEEQEREAKALVANVEAALEKAGFEAEDGPALVRAIQGELQSLAAAKKARAETEAKQKEVEQKRARLDAEVAAAVAQRDVLQARLQELDRKRADVDEGLEEARRALAALAARDGWSQLLPPRHGEDEADVVESQRSERQAEATAARSRVAMLAHEKGATEKALVRAAELAARRATLEKEAALARSLSDHLKAHELVAWIQEEALARLAEAGSRHLQQLSQNRYTLRLGPGTVEPAARVDQDFYVVDGWNGDSIRSVRTLSGGETFLASLALALALAESLTELAAESRATDALESLFLDEGFGTLDAESLDTVVSALDALHGGDRVVGVVTHRRDLAERLPARLEVQKRDATATVVVV